MILMLRYRGRGRERGRDGVREGGREGVKERKGRKGGREGRREGGWEGRWVVERDIVRGTAQPLCHFLIHLNKSLLNKYCHKAVLDYKR